MDGAETDMRLEVGGAEADMRSEVGGAEADARPRSRSSLSIVCQEKKGTHVNWE